MKYYLIAGEASGDLHASKLIAGIRRLDREAEFRCWGGDKMQAEGAEVVKHYRDLAFMGFVEVLMNLRTIAANLNTCKADILQWKPDVLILVDYPGFNMRIAEFAKSRGIPVFYYIAPQVWAWKKKRIHKVHQFTDLVFVVLPFEKAFYSKFGYKAEFVGHPMPDSIASQNFVAEPIFREQNHVPEKPLIALLPGSRRQEIQRILSHMLKIVDKFPEYQFAVAGISTLKPEVYNILKQFPEVKLVVDQTYSLIKYSTAALVTSGTATLETALIGAPQVVCYKMNFFSALIASMLVHVKFISLVNLLLDRKAVTELVQYQLNTKNLMSELTPLLNDTPQRNKMLDDYAELRQVVGGPGASDRAAVIMVDKLKQIKRLPN